MKLINFAFLKLHCLITLIIPIAKLLIRTSLKHNCTWRDKFNAFALSAKSFAITVLVFFLFFFLVTFSGRTAKKFLANLLTFINKTCDQDLNHSLDTPKHISVKIVPAVVIRDARDTWHGLCTVTRIDSHQKSTRTCQNRTDSWKIQGSKHKESCMWKLFHVKQYKNCCSRTSENVYLHSADRW